MSQAALDATMWASDPSERTGDPVEELLDYIKVSRDDFELVFRALNRDGQADLLRDLLTAPNVAAASEQLRQWVVSGIFASRQHLWDTEHRDDEPIGLLYPEHVRQLFA
jgi:hypothetical protein